MFCWSNGIDQINFPQTLTTRYATKNFLATLRVNILVYLNIQFGLSSSRVSIKFCIFCNLTLSCKKKATCENFETRDNLSPNGIPITPQFIPKIYPIPISNNSRSIFHTKQINVESKRLFDVLALEIYIALTKTKAYYYKKTPKLIVRDRLYFPAFKLIIVILPHLQVMVAKRCEQHRLAH